MSNVLVGGWKAAKELKGSWGATSSPVGTWYPNCCLQVMHARLYTKASVEATAHIMMSTATAPALQLDEARFSVFGWRSPPVGGVP